MVIKRALEEFKNRKLIVELYSDPNIRIGTILQIALAFMLFFFAPLEMYFTNKTEYWFDVYVIFGPIAVQTLVAIALLIILLVLVNVLNRILCRIVLLLETSVMLIIYVHGTFLLGDITAINGSVQTIQGKEVLISGIITVMIFLLTLYILLHFRILKTMKIVGFISATLVFVMALSLGIELVLYKGYESKGNYEYATNDGITSYSKQGNVIVILLDHVDCTNFDIAMERYSKWKGKDAFGDFIYYKNMLAMYPYTYFSIPLILSGEAYSYQEFFPDYLNKSISNCTYLNKLKNDGYSLEIYEEGIGREYLLERSITKDFDNMDSEKRVVASYKDFLIQMDSIVLYRYLPYYLKNKVEINNIDFDVFALSVNGKQGYTWDNDFFFENIDKIRADRCKKSFKFIHLKGGHPNFIYDRNMNKKAEEYSLEAYYEQLVGCITMMDDYFNALKEQDIYDDSTIVIMADHGNSCSFDQPGIYNWETCKNPIFMVKGKNQSGSCVTQNDIAMSYEDIDGIMLNILGGRLENEITDGGYQKSERKYLVFHYFDSYKNKGGTLSEFLQSENINDPLVETSNVYVNKWDW